MNFKLILLTVVLISFSPINQLFATPTYASKWKLADKEICLFGDTHIPVLGDFDVASALYKKVLNLRALILSEDLFNPQLIDENLFNEIYAYFHVSIDKDFLFTFNKIARTMAAEKRTRNEYQTIDPRYQWEISIIHIIRLLKRLEKSPSIEESTIILEDLEKLKKIVNVPLSTLLIQPISLLEEMIVTATPESVSIFENLRNAFLSRYKTLRKYLKQKGFSDNELEEIPLSEILSNHAEKKHYELIFKLFVGKDDTIFQYFCPIVEAQALWHIVNTIKKTIIVVAGCHHVWKLEQYLEQLGYKCLKQEDPGNDKQWDANFTERMIDATSYLNNDPKFLGNPDSLFYKSLFHEMYWSPFPATVKALIEESDARKENIQQISHEAFDWVIHEKYAQPATRTAQETDNEDDETETDKLGKRKKDTE